MYFVQLRIAKLDEHQHASASEDDNDDSNDFRNISSTSIMQMAFANDNMEAVSWKFRFYILGLLREKGRIGGRRYW